MEVDGRVVSERLSTRLRPTLREFGFSRFEGRHSWRRHDHSVDLVSFPSIVARNAVGVGCTVFSFGGEAGVYYPALDKDAPVKLPRPWQLTFRGLLGKSIRQPFFHPWGSYPSGEEEWRRDRADIWYVLDDGSNLDEVIEDAFQSMTTQALPMIERFGSPARAVRSMQDGEWTDPGFGTLGLKVGSPNDAFNLALTAGLEKLARGSRLAARGSRLAASGSRAAG